MYIYIFVITGIRTQFIKITEESTIETITEQAKEIFQLENISLVQSNGHHFENSDTTKGLQFWKSPARKVYAIPNILAQETGSTKLTEQMGRKN